MQNIVYPMKLMSSNLCCPPPMDWLKINVDGGLNVQSEDGGAGVAIRHDNESFLRVNALDLPNCLLQGKV